MRRREAELIGSKLEEFDFDCCVNLGSGDVVHQKKTKPWIDQQIFSKLQIRGVDIIHADISLGPDIDIIIDLTCSTSVEKLNKFMGKRCFLLCNVLEHIPRTQVYAVLNNLNRVLTIGDVVVISVPRSYPYHADPIDSMFRPSPSELSSMIDLQWEMVEEVITGNFFEDLAGMSPAKRVRKLLKPFWFFQRVSKYRECVSRLRYLVNDYMVSIVIGVKK